MDDVNVAELNVDVGRFSTVDAIRSDVRVVGLVYDGVVEGLDFDLEMKKQRN